MNTPDVNDQIEAIRYRLNRADSTPALESRLGDILIALYHVTDLLEQTNKRIDALDEWHERWKNT